MFGSVLLDGQPHTPGASRQVAFVTQRDFLLPTLTVLECLRYSALLRLPRGTSPAEVQVCARTVWPAIMLTRCCWAALLRLQWSLSPAGRPSSAAPCGSAADQVNRPSQAAVGPSIT